MHTNVNQSIQVAFQTLESRFINPETGLLFNYTNTDGTVQLPTEEECSLGKPNHLSWNCPLEDGAYYNGLYLDALVNRALYMNCLDAKRAAERTAKGLLSLLVCGPESGFIARGYIGKHKYHYRAGSNDQTFPWFYGLWRYARSSICIGDAKATCISSVEQVAMALHHREFKIPSDPPEMGDRGNYMLPNPADVAKLLFICRALYDLTSKDIWLERYNEYLKACPIGSNQTRFEILSRGAGFEPYDGQSVFYCLADGEAMEHVFGEKKPIITTQLFTRSMVDIALRGLMDMTMGEPEWEVFRQALIGDAKHLLTHIPRYKGYISSQAPDFSDNWRVMNALWHPHNNMRETGVLAWRQMPLWFRECPRFPYENAFVREPLYAGYVVALCGTEEIPDAKEALSSMLTYYHWDTLYTSTFYVALLIHGQLLANKNNQP
ncbi:MAG: hypothetical protein ACOX55_04455 [Christensenellales bacterium]